MPQLPTYKIADETFVIPHAMPNPAGAGPLYFNCQLIRGREPILVDTGAPLHREAMLKAIFELVDPLDVRWIFLTHDDRDHVGNLTEILAACPNAMLVTSWLMHAKMSPEFTYPISRMIIQNHGDTFDAGDRTMVTHIPPCFDAPTTRGLFDTKTKTYFPGDCFGAPVAEVVEYVDQISAPEWEWRMLAFNAANHRWIKLADQARFDKVLNEFKALGAEFIASSHGPVARHQTEWMVETLRRSIKEVDYQEMTQAGLDAMLKAHGSAAHRPGRAPARSEASAAESREATSAPRQVIEVVTSEPGDRVTLKGKPLYSLDIQLTQPSVTGPNGLPANGARAIFPCVGGKTYGRLEGDIIGDMSADWTVVVGVIDGHQVLEIDARFTVRTHDGAHVLVRPHGYAFTPNSPTVWNPDTLWEVRVSQRFETDDPRYAFLRSACAVGIGKQARGRIQIDLYTLVP